MSVISDNINSTMQQYEQNPEAAAGVDFMQSRVDLFLNFSVPIN